MKSVTFRRVWRSKAIERSLRMLVLTCVLAISLGNFRLIEAQPPTWDEPVNISISPRESMFPSADTDASGNVHVVWCEADPTRTCDAINYAHFDGTTWSPPVDILVAGSSEVATTPTLAIDASGILHLTWVGGFGDRVLYSQAYAPLAGSARSWSPPAVISSVLPLTEFPDVAVGSDGVIHVVYAVRVGDGSGIFHSRSIDGGEVWTDPVPVYSDNAINRSVWEPRLAVDPAGGLHVAWTEASFPESFPPLGLQYAQSLDGGDTWSAPISRPGPYSLSGILAVTDSEVHHVWSGTSPDRYKFHSWSSDRGVTWSNPTRTSDVGGFEGWPSLAVDASASVHLLQVAGAATALTHQAWHDGNWSPAVNLVAMIPGASNHPTNADLAVGLGNQLHGVVSHFIETPPESGVWQFDVYYVHKALSDVPHSEPQPLPTQIAFVDPTPLPTMSPQTVVAGESSPTIVPVASSTSAPAAQSAIPSPLLAGALSAGLLVAVISAVSIIRKRR